MPRSSLPACEQVKNWVRRHIGPQVASVDRLVYPGTRYSFAGQFQA